MLLQGMQSSNAMLQQLLHEALAALEASHTTASNAHVALTCHHQCADVIQREVQEAVTKLQAKPKASVSCCFDASEKVRDELCHERLDNRQRMRKAMDHMQGMPRFIT